MGYGRENFDDTWADLVPEQPKRGTNWVLWLAAAGGALLVGCLVLGGAYLIGREYFSAPTAIPTPIVPTLPGSTPVGETPVGETPGGATAEATTSAPTETSAPADTPLPQPTITLAGQATSPPITSSSVEAIRLSGPPTIDGNLGEWGGAPAYLSAFRVFSAASWDGTDDLTAVWRLAWDNNNLYIAVEVTDNVHVQTQSGNQIFRGDSVDMQFDTDRPGDFGDGVSPDDFQIIFSPGNFATLPESAFRFQGTNNGRILDAPGGNSVTVRAQKTATGYTLEAAIPWNNLNLTPAQGLVIGLALNANDNDGPGTAVQEVLMSNVSTRTLTDPRSWGTLTLR